MLVRIERRRFAGRAAGDKPMTPLAHLPLDEGAKSAPRQTLRREMASPEPGSTRGTSSPPSPRRPRRHSSSTNWRQRRSGPDKEGGVILSSMQKKAGLLLLLGVSVAAVAGGDDGAGRGQEADARRASRRRCCRSRPKSGLQAAPAYSPIASDVARWNSLRQSDSLPFSSYASFLLSHRGWPGETAMRRTAEKARRRQRRRR